MQNHLPLLIGAAQDECLFAISTSHVVLAPILVHLDLGLVGNYEVTGVIAHSIVDIDRKISHLTGQIKVL